MVIFCTAVFGCQRRRTRYFEIEPENAEVSNVPETKDLAPVIGINSLSLAKHPLYKQTFLLSLMYIKLLEFRGIPLRFLGRISPFEMSLVMILRPSPGFLLINE